MARIYLQGIVLLLLIVHAWGIRRSTRKPKHIQPSVQQVEKTLTHRIRNATPEQLQKGQMAAARKMEQNLGRTLSALQKSRGHEMSEETKAQAQEILVAIKAGELHAAVVQALPTILLQTSSKAPPAQQLQQSLMDISPRAPLALKGPLDGLMNFVRTNVNGVNSVLMSTVNGIPTATQGVVGSLANTLGVASNSVGSGLDALNGVVGGLLSGGLVPTSLLGGGLGGNVLGGALGGSGSGSVGGGSASGGGGGILG